jgi:hypothetical protein
LDLVLKKEIELSPSFKIKKYKPPEKLPNGVYGD